MSEQDLKHFGVKGMRWGVRRTPTQLAKGYSKNQYKYDKREYGRKSADRVNDRMKKGDDLATARKSEQEHRRKVDTYKALAALGAPLAAKVAIEVGSLVVAGLAVGAQAKRVRDGARESASALADVRGIPAYQTYNASYNSRSGLWE